MTAIEQPSVAARPEGSRSWKKLRSSRSALAGLIIIAFFSGLAILAPLLPIADPVATSWSAIR
ncbi:MAG: ABC transporter permease, partial [Pannonibacter indicus]